MTVSQKLGIILESKLVQKLSYEKTVFNEWWSPRLIFLDEFFFEKIRLNFKIDFESTILALFDKLSLLKGIF
mgnify:CR=1 FL=1